MSHYIYRNVTWLLLVCYLYWPSKLLPVLLPVTLPVNKNNPNDLLPVCYLVVTCLVANKSIQLKYFSYLD